MSWKDQIKNSIQTLDELEKFSNLTMEEKENLSKIIEKYPMKLTPYYASLIDWANKKDPLRAKVIPSNEELLENNLTSNDSYDEEKYTIFPGLEHKYDTTALVLVNSNCAGYCRECFRKSFISDTEDPFKRQILTDYDKLSKYIKEHDEIKDILITGGEPLLLNNLKLENLLKTLTELPNIQKIRIGTKIPAYLPQRINEDDQLVELLKKYNNEKEIRMIAHFNHPHELSNEAKKAIKKIKNIGIRIYNQTALLRGVNDNADTLRKLFVELDNSGIIPYYVFEEMPQKGTSHFSIPTKEGFTIFERAIENLEGTAQTAKYVIPKKEGKLQVLDVYEKNNDFFARAKYLKTAKNYVGETKFEIKLEGETK